MGIILFISMILMILSGIIIVAGALVVIWISLALGFKLMLTGAIFFFVFVGVGCLCSNE